MTRYGRPPRRRKQVANLARALSTDVLALSPAAAHVAGEYSLTHAVTRELQMAGVSVVVACTDRVAREEARPDGTIATVREFEFVRWRRVAE